MTRDNYEDKVQFCRELGVLVCDMLSSSNELLLVIKEIIRLYIPRTSEEVDEFWSLQFRISGGERLLCELRKITMPDDDDFYDSIAPLKDIAEDVAMRMISAEVIVNDIFTIYSTYREDNTYARLFITTLKAMTERWQHMTEKMEKIHKETSQQWPELIPSYDKTGIDDEDEYEEEAVLPGESESFCLMKSALIEAFTKYTNGHKSERISDFFVALQKYLEDFENGIESDEEFAFNFNLVTGYHANNDINFNFESGLIEVVAGGSVYDKEVGGDSYTDWMYSVWLNGSEDNNYYNCDFQRVVELVCAGAKLTIDSPDEYMLCGEDE